MPSTLLCLLRRRGGGRWRGKKATGRTRWKRVCKHYRMQPVLHFCPPALPFEFTVILLGLSTRSVYSVCTSSWLLHLSALDKRFHVSTSTSRLFKASLSASMARVRPSWSNLSHSMTQTMSTSESFTLPCPNNNPPVRLPWTSWNRASTRSSVLCNVSAAVWHGSYSATSASPLGSPFSTRRTYVVHVLTKSDVCW
jgi:hypothetical protein